MVHGMVMQGKVASCMAHARVMQSHAYVMVRHYRITPISRAHSTWTWLKSSPTLKTGLPRGNEKLIHNLFTKRKGSIEQFRVLITIYNMTCKTIINILLYHTKWTFVNIMSKLTIQASYVTDGEKHTTMIKLMLHVHNNMLMNTITECLCQTRINNGDACC